MEKILELTRQIGHLLQEQDCFKNYIAAREANDTDENLQKQIGEFNIVKLSLDAELAKEDRDEDKLKSINEEMRALYSTIMENESMKNYQNAKMLLDKTVNGIYNVIAGSADGINPDELDFSESCGGDCATCGGCH